MKKVISLIIFTIIVTGALFLFRLNSIRNELYEFNTMKSNCQIVRTEVLRYPNFFEMNGKSATLKEVIDKMKNKVITADEEKDVVNSIIKYNSSLGKLDLENYCSFSDAEKLPDCPLLKYFTRATDQFYGFCKHFIEKNDDDTALLMAYMPIIIANKVQNEYANCSSPRNKLVNIKLIQKACQNLEYVINNSKPDIQKVKLVIKDLKNILEKDPPLSRCVKYEKYIFNYELEEKAKQGNKTAMLIQNDKSLKDYVEKPLNDILAYIDQPYSKIRSDLIKWEDDVLEKQLDILPMINAFNHNEPIKHNMLVRYVYGNYNGLAKEKDNEINSIKKTIQLLAGYCYSGLENKELPNDETLEKWINEQIK